ncbi:MAG TPA: glycosyltransferase family 4 protein, partial [Tepidisphaeraceae bacterium]
MRVFMLGWEFPPFISGGLGTACYGLTKAMSGLGTEILFVLPRPVTSPFSTHVKLLSPRAGSPLASPVTEFRLDEFEHVTFRAINSKMGDPYARPEDEARAAAAERARASKGSMVEGALDTDIPTANAGVTTAGGAQKGTGDHYGGDMFAEIQRYAALASEIARQESFDVVHAHDWMTFPAGLAVAGIKGVPLVVHVHSTEFDRSGVNVDTRIYDIERRGMHGAMKIIAVSILTKNIVTHHYGIDPAKVEVVYNAVEINGNGFDEEKYKIHKDEKIVLFLGRITMQKGPEYFLAAAKKVLEVMDNVKFV